MASRILIVEDERNIAELLIRNFQQAGFETDAVYNGTDALLKAEKTRPNLILLDLLLPELDGIEVCRLLKRNPETQWIPVVMLTAKGEEVDRIVGLELGADDYITKPFSPREVVLRVQAILRRTASEKTVPENSKIHVNGITIDLQKHQAFSQEGLIDLTSTEFKMLSLFAGSPGRVFTRSILMDVVWGQEYYGVDRTIDTHISRLRRKLGGLGDLIETVHGVGYRFKA